MGILLFDFCALCDVNAHGYVKIESRNQYFCEKFPQTNIRLHIFFNLFFQSRVGFGVEEQLGTRKFMLLYLFCGYFGNLVSVLWDPYYFWLIL